MQELELENCSIHNTYIHNTVDESKFKSSSYGDIEVDTINSATIPLVNGGFFDLRQDIDVPASVKFAKWGNRPQRVTAHALFCHL